MRRRGARRLDEHQKAAITYTTLKRYRQAAARFAEFLSERFPFAELDDWDDALVEYKDSESVTKSEFEMLIAALDFRLP